MHAFVPMPVGDRCGRVPDACQSPDPAQGTQARFKASFDHQSQVRVSSPDAAPAPRENLGRVPYRMSPARLQAPRGTSTVLGRAAANDPAGLTTRCSGYRGRGRREYVCRQHRSQRT